MQVVNLWSRIDTESKLGSSDGPGGFRNREPAVEGIYVMAR